jgi:hypothetical protein
MELSSPGPSAFLWLPKQPGQPPKRSQTSPVSRPKFPQDPSLEPPKMIPALRAGRVLRAPTNPILSELGELRSMVSHHICLASAQSLGPQGWGQGG